MEAPSQGEASTIKFESKEEKKQLPSKVGKVMMGICSWTDNTLISCKRFYPRHLQSALER